VTESAPGRFAARTHCCRAGDDGIGVFFDDSEFSTVAARRNKISDSTLNGIDIYVDDSDGNEFALFANEISRSGEDGIQAFADAGSDDDTFRFGGNEIRGTGEYGIEVEALAPGSNLSSSFVGPPVNNSVKGAAAGVTNINGVFDGSLRVNGVDVP